MVNRARRKPIRGVAERVLDHVFEALSSEEWAELLKAPLERAAHDGDRGLAKKLVEAGADVGCALHKAVHGGHRVIINHLLENGASVNDKDTKGFVPLRIAAEVGDADVVESLLRKGADKDTWNVQGYTAVYAAAVFGRFAATKALLAAGADIGIRCGEFEKVALHGAAKNGHADILLEHGADVHEGDREGSTALHYSSCNDTVGIVDALVKAGANVNARDQHGGTPLHDAANDVNQGAVLALLKHGADINANTNVGSTPLHLAACKSGKQGAAQMVDVLLRWGAHEMAIDAEGDAPADAIGELVEEQDRLAEDVEHVRAEAVDKCSCRQGLAPSGISDHVSCSPRQAAGEPGTPRDRCQVDAEDSQPGQAS